MIVTADAGSIYSPHPQVSFEWDPTRTVKSDSTSHSAGYYSSPMSQSPLQTSPYGGSPYSPQASQSIGWLSSPNSVSTVAYGQELWVYHGPYGSCTFWRMMVQIPLSENEMCVSYSVNNGHRIQFYVPGKGQEMRWATYSVSGTLAALFLLMVVGSATASVLESMQMIFEDRVMLLDLTLYGQTC